MNEPVQTEQPQQESSDTEPDQVPISKGKRILLMTGHALWFLLTLFVMAVSFFTHHIVGMKTFVQEDVRRQREQDQNKKRW